jgi:hypothetical protein
MLHIEFVYDEAVPVADNFLGYVEATNKDRAERQRQSGGYSLPSMQPITDEQQLQRVWEHFLNEYSTYIKKDAQNILWAKIKDSAKKLLNDNSFGGVPKDFRIKTKEQFIINFLYNRGFAHTKLMMKRIEDYIKESDPKLMKYNSIEDLLLFDDDDDEDDVRQKNRDAWQLFMRSGFAALLLYFVFLSFF